ncbi:MAG TPA: hypothetical protein VE573_10170 [Nitrososphaeraceae archaeon]|jgi:hypothetical protein|nr:hypothetical protein [Nitrososphaeraceae archaeon]
MNNRTTTVADISDILLLVENFPINNRLEIDLDAKVSVKDKKEIIERLGMNSKLLSFRDIINLLTNFIQGIYSTDAKIASVDRLDELRKIGCTYPAQYLLFDFCLAALEGDYLDAKLFLGHASQIIGLSNQFNLLLSAIVYTPLTNEPEVRQLLTLLALEVQPAKLDAYLELYGKEFQTRYQMYKDEIMKLK